MILYIHLCTRKTSSRCFHWVLHESCISCGDRRPFSTGHFHTTSTLTFLKVNFEELLSAENYIKVIKINDAGSSSPTWRLITNFMCINFKNGSKSRWATGKWANDQKIMFARFLFVNIFHVIYKDRFQMLSMLISILQKNKLSDGFATAPRTSDLCFHFVPFKRLYHRLCRLCTCTV